MQILESTAIGRPGGCDDEPDFEQPAPILPEPGEQDGHPQEIDGSGPIGRSGGDDDEPAAYLPSATTTPDKIVELPTAKSETSTGKKHEDETSSWIIGAGWIIFWGAIAWVVFQAVTIVVATVRLPFILRWPALAAEAAIFVFAAVWFARVVGFLVGFRKRCDTDPCGYYKRLVESETFRRQIPEPEREELLEEAKYLFVRRENFQREWESRRKAFEGKREKIAEGIVREHAVLTALKTATSPWKAVDVLAVFYNSTRMVERIAKLYDQPCGRSQAFRLVCRWAFNLYVAGELGEVMETGANMTVEKAAEYFENTGCGISWLGSVLPIAGKVFAKAGEGATNYYFCQRLGQKAIEAFKPDPEFWKEKGEKSKWCLWAIAISALFAVWFIVVGLFMLFRPAKESQEGTIPQNVPVISTATTQESVQQPDK